MIRTALIEGVIWSVLWMIYVYIIVVRFPWEMLHDYTTILSLAIAGIDYAILHYVFWK